MKIASIGLYQAYNNNKSNNHNNKKIAFKAADINILAMADQHGNVTTMPQVEQTIRLKAKDLFKAPSAKSTLNVFANAGDFFINPSKQGYLTHPEKTNGDIQAEFLKGLIEVTNEVVGENSNFEAVFTPGNHDFDGGDQVLYEKLAKLPMTTIMTNVNRMNSPLLSEYIKENKNMAISKIFTIADDKNPDLKHKVLFIGATIPTMDFYAPGLLKGTEFYGNSNKKDANITEDEMVETINAIEKVVKKFKKDHPKGAVVLMSHMGTNISKMVKKSIPDINIILNGHDHSDKTKFFDGSRAITSLGEDNRILRSINLHFQDSGELDDEIDFITHSPLAISMENIENNRLSKLIENSLQKDLLPLIKRLDKDNEIKELKYGNFIRYSNSHLMNYITSAIHGVLKNEYPQHKDLAAVAVQSSGVRGGIKEGANNLDLMKIFDGVSEDLSGAFIGEVPGKDLLGLIVENVKDNLKKPDRNTLLHWSSIQIDRTLIAEILSGKSKAEFVDAVKFRNPLSKQFDIPIDIFEDYKILLPNKYLVKTDIEYPNKIRKYFEPLGQTSDQLLRQALRYDNYVDMAQEKVKEIRVL